MGDWSPEKDCCWRLTFRQPERKPSSESPLFRLTLKMASAQVVETSVANNSPYQDSNHPHDHFQSRDVTPWFKPFSFFFFIVHQEKLTRRMRRQSEEVRARDELEKGNLDR